MKMTARMDVFNKAFLSQCIKCQRIIIKLNGSQFWDSFLFPSVEEAQMYQHENSHHHMGMTNIYRGLGWALIQAEIVYTHCHFLSQSNSTKCVRVLSKLRRGGDWDWERVRVLPKTSHIGSGKISLKPRSIPEFLRWEMFQIWLIWIHHSNHFFILITQFQNCGYRWFSWTQLFLKWLLIPSSPSFQWFYQHLITYIKGLSA